MRTKEREALCALTQGKESPRAHPLPRSPGNRGGISGPIYKGVHFGTNHFGIGTATVNINGVRLSIGPPKVRYFLI